MYGLGKTLRGNHAEIGKYVRPQGNIATRFENHISHVDDGRKNRLVQIGGADEEKVIKCFRLLKKIGNGKIETSVQNSKMQNVQIIPRFDNDATDNILDLFDGINTEDVKIRESKKGE